MAKIQFEGKNNVSKPVKRMRWATQRAPGQSGMGKRLSILNRHKPTASTEEAHNAKVSPYAEEARAEDPSSTNRSEPRTIYVNIPLPDEAKDEQGHIKQRYARNKIRTSKYTPLSFIPKNLWFQFHNIANIYFFFIIILSVCQSSPTQFTHLLKLRLTDFLYFRRFEPRTRLSSPDCHHHAHCYQRCH
jgi:phospholipid-translocating ATPase